MLLGLSMDLIYQHKVSTQFYPAEAVVIALLLAVVPYFILRWIVERMARWWFARQQKSFAMTDQRITGNPTPTNFGRAVLAPHRHVVPAHAHERGPHADVGDPHVAVADQLRLHDLPGVREAAGPECHHACRRRANFGVTLVALGILMLIGGIVYHVQFMIHLREEREAMTADGLIHGESKFPVSLTLITALILLLIGVVRDREHGVSGRAVRLSACQSEKELKCRTKTETKSGIAPKRNNKAASGEDDLIEIEIWKGSK